MERLNFTDLDAAKMLVKILLSKGAINEQTASAVFDRINEIRKQKQAA